MIVCDNTKQAERLGNFFYQLERRYAESERKASIISKKPSRPLEVGTTIGSAALFKTSKAALSTIPAVIIF